MTGELLKPPDPLEVDSYRGVYTLEDWHEKMPGYDLVVFFHRLLVERDLLIDLVVQAKGLPPGTYPLPSRQLTETEKELLRKLKSD